MIYFLYEDELYSGYKTKMPDNSYAYFSVAFTDGIKVYIDENDIEDLGDDFQTIKEKILTI